MRSAKKVSIPDNRRLSYDDYCRLRKHAFNSALFYITTYNKNSFEVHKKLLDKGFIEDDVIVVDANHYEKSMNIIQDVFQDLKESLLIDDEAFVKDYIDQNLSNGKSIQYIKMRLLSKYVPTSMVNEIIEEYSDDFNNNEDIALDIEGSKILKKHNISSIDDDNKRKQKFLQAMVRKGFNFQKSLEWYNDNFDE